MVASFTGKAAGIRFGGIVQTLGFVEHITTNAILGDYKVLKRNAVI